MRRLETLTNTATGREARVYRDSDWQEWRVKHYQDGEHLTAADYHTDDKADALNHARHWTAPAQQPTENPDAWIDSALMQAYDDHCFCDDF
jgi:hypothetical protein